MIATGVIAGIGIAVILTFLVLGYVSRSGVPLGLVNGKLAPCPNRPNCVSSEDKTDIEHYTTPIILPTDFSGNILMVLNQAITDLGGIVGTSKGPYLSATFKSTVFGFIDDLEIRVDNEASRIHVRSGSRVALTG